MVNFKQNLYDESYKLLTEANAPILLADAASRIVATDNPSKPNLGRNEIDNEICQDAARLINLNLYMEKG